jgi:chemotaxis family two-component system response regulator PixG
MSGSLIANELEEKVQTYREQQFTGLVKVGNQREHQWYIYYLLGRIVWTKSRTHSLRRWQRHLAIHSPVFFEQITQPVSLSYESWNYTALARLVKLKQFRRDQFSKVVESCITEDLFDILQVGTLQQQAQISYEAHPKEAANLPFIMLQQETAWQEAQQEWQAWEQAGLAKFSPDWAPAIAQIEALRAQTPPQTFQTLTTFVDGKSTLRDLAIKFRQPVILLTKSILPYVSRQMLSLADIPDIVENAHDGFHPELTDKASSVPATSPFTDLAASQANPVSQSLPPAQQPPIQLPVASTPPTLQPQLSQASLAANLTSHSSTLISHANTQSGRKVKSNAPRIIYIDDSPADSRSMCEIVESLGYQYTNIPDPLQALPMLIELKPKLIFLDLVMPIANGYEVCAQIRRISAFRDTPIIIVTSNDGIADRVRAKIVGASGFLGKPIQHKKVLKVLKKHIRQGDHQPVQQGVLSAL